MPAMYKISTQSPQDLSVHVRLAELKADFQQNRGFYSIQDQIDIDQLFELASTSLHANVLAELLEANAVEAEWPAVPVAAPFSGRMAA